MERIRFVVVMAGLITLTLWLGGCSTVSGLADDIKDMSEGVRQRAGK